MLANNFLALFAALSASSSLVVALRPPEFIPFEQLVDRSIDLSLIERGRVSGPTPPCNVTVVNPPPKGFHCNVKGVLTHQATPIFGPTTSTSDNCRDTCLANNKCISFGFNTATNKCVQYGQTLESQGIKASSTSKVVYSNRRCFKRSCVKCTTSLPTYCSGNSCTNTQTDSNNCGSCGNVCPTIAPCSQGRCTCSANSTLAGTPPCRQSCNIDYSSDNNNCGACGNACPDDETCSGGTCQTLLTFLRFDNQPSSDYGNDLLTGEGIQPRFDEGSAGVTQVNPYTIDPNTGAVSFDPGNGNPILFLQAGTTNGQTCDTETTSNPDSPLPSCSVGQDMLLSCSVTVDGVIYDQVAARRVQIGQTDYAAYLALSTGDYESGTYPLKLQSYQDTRH